MQFISFVRKGRTGFGLLKDDGIADLTGRLRPDIVTLKEALRAGVLPTPEEAGSFPAELTLSDVVLLPLIPDPDKILCVGLNYATHVAETKNKDSEYPTIFTRFADSQIAHGHPIIKPKSTERLDFEGELAIVIGRGGRHIAEENAMEHVAGYACYNDVSVRNWQRHTHQFTPGKNFPGTGPFGPALVMQDEVPDYTKLTIKTVLNGEVVQDSALDKLIFTIPHIIAYCSTFTPLSAGDVIITGTPGGLGDRREPPLYMNEGDEVEVIIPGVGHLINPVVQER